MSIRHLLSMCCCSLAALTTTAQELNAKILVNHNQIQGTDASVFDNLRQTLEQFVNDRPVSYTHLTLPTILLV